MRAVKLILAFVVFGCSSGVPWGMAQDLETPLPSEVTPAVTQNLLASDQERSVEDFFEAQVRPVLIASCLECHGSDSPEADIRLDSLAGMLAGNSDGPVIVPFQPDASRLIQAIRHAGGQPMPPEGKLGEGAIQALTHWVEIGAPWPESIKIADPAAMAREHWAYQPVIAPEIPATSPAESWAKTDLDRFVLQRLATAGLQPNESADRRVLIRRLTFDLLGLPPGTEDVESLLADTSPAALENLVDRLLDSPQFGERWGRYWLDVARYADTKGYVFEEDRNYKTAYLYRDWVIQAFNRDLPYDQFLIRQLAVDQLEGLNGDAGELAAMGFWTLGRRFLNNPHDINDDRIDVMTRGMMGLTVACARCHDHKYDPISAADYYSLYGVLAASTETQVSFEEPTKEFQEELERRKVELREYEQGEAKQGRLNELRRKIAEWENSEGAPTRVMVLQDRTEGVEDPHIFIRGNPDRLGEVVPRRFIGFLSSGEERPFTQGSGRLELAQAIADPNNPLTARVWVNRVWGYLFGQGLVKTASDFGLRSDPPSHPELLDWLAAKFVEEGWSTKRLIREIVLSATYQQSSEVQATAIAIDPENRLLWRQNRRRLDFEAMRDRFLAVSGMMDATLLGPSVDITQPPFSHRRTVYSFIDRQNLPGLFRTFDFASPDAHSPGRFSTTVPQQALFLMNHAFVIEMARAVLTRVEMSPFADRQQRVERLYELLFHRLPTAEELSLAQEFFETEWESMAERQELCGETETEADASDTTNARDEVWTQYIQALLMTNEFFFID